MKPAAEPTRQPADDFTRAEEAADYLRVHAPSCIPRSRSCSVPDSAPSPTSSAAPSRIPYADIPHFPQPSRRGPRRPAGDRQSRHRAGGLHAGPGSFVRRPQRARRRLPGARALSLRHPRLDSHQRRRRDQRDLHPGLPGRAQGPHQPAGRQSAHRRQRRALRPAFPRHDPGLLPPLSPDHARARQAPRH